MSGLALLVPAGLLALLGLPVVVLLHMRQPTPRPRAVPTLRFWLAAMHEQPRQARLRRPPLTLLLLLHLLIVGLLAFGLTRPAAVNAWGGLGLRTEPRHVILLLDGSTSMGATDTVTGASRFETARALALDRVRDLHEGDVATVVVLGTRVTTFEATSGGEFPALRARLASLTPPGGRTDLSAALTLTKDLLLPQLTDQVVLITDGALTVDPAVVAGLGAPVELVRVGGAATDPATGNIAITDLVARAAPGNPARQQLYLRLANFSDAPVTAPLVLTTDGIETARQDVTIPAGGAWEKDWGDLPQGATTVMATIVAPDALAADNQATLILRQSSDLALKILLVSDTPGPLQRALAVLPGSQLDTEASDSAANRNVGAAYDLVVYESVAPPTGPLPDAALLFVHPPAANGPFPTQGAMTTPTATRVQAQDPLLSGVDLGGVTFGDTPVYQLQGDQQEIVGGGGGPLIFRGTLQGRQMVTLAFDVAQSNIVRRVAFPILIANIARQLVPSPLPPAVALGDPLLYRPSADTALVRVTTPDGQTVDVPVGPGGAAAPAGQDSAGAAGNATDPATDPALRTVSFTDTGQAGEYDVTELNADGAPLGGGKFVVNAGHPSESDLRPNPELPGILAAARGGTETSINQSLADLWPALVAAALALLALEWLVTLWPRRSSFALRVVR